MRTIVLVGLVLCVAACSHKPKPQPAAAPAPAPTIIVQAPPAPEVPSVEVTNTLSQAVRVYVTQGTTDTFLRQVAANTTVRVPVPTIPAGTSVSLKAVTADSTRTYSRDNVVLGGVVAFHIP